MPSDEYTPTMRYVRNHFADLFVWTGVFSRRELNEKFDRALAVHDAEVRRDEREKCAQIADADFSVGSEVRRENYVRQEIAAAIRAQSEEANR